MTLICIIATYLICNRDKNKQDVLPQELKKARSTAIELKKEGYDAKKLKNKGYTAKELKDAEYTVKQLKDAGFNLDQYKSAIGFVNIIFFILLFAN
ncbi:MAG: hypothetical protein ACN23H_00915 [Candidatus Phytoplasma vitis]|nr:MAG: hypothetical protein M6G77_00790 [Candidatus Phytoplasma vitis]